MSCYACSSTLIETDPESGSRVCAKCGVVQEESWVVSDVTFMEGANGATVVQGHFVADNAVPSSSLPSFSSSAAAPRNHSRTAKESRELTIQRNKIKTRQIATALHLNNYHVEVAHRFFLLAMESHNFTQGRRSENVVGACLYIACRKENTPSLSPTLLSSLSLLSSPSLSAPSHAH